MQKLINDFSITPEDAAAILGNIGHECNGFQTMQEVKPVVPGSKGGWGWCQWTGPRRRQFDAWVRRRGLNPSSDEANYSFLYRELSGEEGEPKLRAINKVRAAKTLDEKVIAFEKDFLRAGIKHYDSRYVYAKAALAAYNESELIL